MSPSVTGSVGRGNPADAPAASPAAIVLAERARQMRELAEAMEALADKHTEELDYEGYSGLMEHAAELKAVAKTLVAENLSAVIAEMLDHAEGHHEYLRQLCEKGGDA